MKVRRKIKFYLASQSPRRFALLKEWGYQFRTIPAHSSFSVDETPRLNESPEEYVNRIARTKACYGRLTVNYLGWGSRPVLAADTIVVFDGKLLGKPKSVQEAKEMLRNLSGNTHQVCTAVFGVLPDHSIRQKFSASSVTFKVLEEKEIEAYVNTGESMDKAGAYGIQGLAGSFVTNINGSYTGIMGLPMYETVQLLREMHVRLPFTQHNKSH